MKELKTSERKGQSTQERERIIKFSRKTTEYGRQLQEKQKVKQMYGVLERQFKRFFALATKSKGATGETLLSLLERRLDNVVYRLKMAVSRTQARQIIVHGHILVNGKKVTSPSYLVSPEDEITIAESVLTKPVFLDSVIDKRLNTNVKIPDWLELDRKARTGRVLRIPVRSDIQTPIEEHLIVELYSK